MTRAHAKTDSPHPADAAALESSATAALTITSWLRRARSGIARLRQRRTVGAPALGARGQEHGAGRTSPFVPSRFA